MCQLVMYEIVSEMMLSVDPAAWNTRKRVLTRENSLTGESAVTESPMKPVKSNPASADCASDVSRVQQQPEKP